MKITLLVIGKTDEEYLNKGISIYTSRLSHYIKFGMVEILPPRNFRQLNPQQLKEAEGKLLLRYFEDSDHVILLDEQGKLPTSVEFSGILQKHMNAGVRHLMFVVGGAFGFSDEVYQAAKSKLSLSPMTFSHQMVRLFFTEQLYRAFTILRNEPYHNN
ncbi:MAG: 23S rRNA (pseudouridine(1915)-N(3))-methyltransferase RlmH [Lentimicrobiaceae bacterium]|nr:23S rRNA (pseudouridine(1915)-N(3))-methyltransferase RlmH [Lentimicrobiaceae bacterium]